MKKIIFSILITFLAVNVQAQQRKVILPGEGHIDVEQLKDYVDLSQDVSKLSISETRVLRNAIAARQGYCLMSADLRSIYSATSWYDSIMEKRYWEEDEAAYNAKSNVKKPQPIGYTRGEINFIKKLQAHEIELRKHNFDVEEGQKVNINNIVNPFQMTAMPDELNAALAKNGFAIVPDNTDQLFQIYENNDYHDFPNFVTTDLFLQAFHTYFDALLRDMETQKFDSLLQILCRGAYDEFGKIINSPERKKKSKEAAKYMQAYFAVAINLLTGEQIPAVDGKYEKMVADEVNKVNKAQNDFSEFLEYKTVPFGYDIFRPRGHYTRSEQLSRYFRAMMWLQTVPFATDKRQQLERAVVLAEAVGDNSKLRSTYEKIFQPLTYLMGRPDNVTILQLLSLQHQTGLSTDDLLKNTKKMKELKAKVEALAEKQTLIRPHFVRTGRYKINFMPQRYQPDALVLQEMVDYKTPITKRAVPKGLDVLAAIGVSEAERILIDEMGENRRWDKFSTTLSTMKNAMSKTDWKASTANQWIESLKDVTAQADDTPYFMQGQAWAKKNLNTALASWTELKHDAILYAKQPAGAECGGGGPPAPIVKGFVEPNIAYWSKAIELLDNTLSTLKKFDLQTEKAINSTTSLREQAEFFLDVSRKELAGKSLSDSEYNRIEYVGSTFEYITLHLINNGDQALDGWFDVTGADKKVSLVVDVYTANADNNPNKSVLYEAVGPAHKIYVVVEMGGYLYITRGAVFSYREFQEDISAPRLTDEEWQKRLETQPNQGIPTWMEDIIVPLNGQDLDNETFFYSTGC